MTRLTLHHIWVNNDYRNKISLKQPCFLKIDQLFLKFIPVYFIFLRIIILVHAVKLHAKCSSLNLNKYSIFYSSFIFRCQCSWGKKQKSNKFDRWRHSWHYCCFNIVCYHCRMLQKKASLVSI